MGLHPEMRSPDEGVSSVIALTTLVVAAWTPEGSLLVSWVGDSMAFLVPIAGGPGWHSTPHGGPMGFVSRGIGMFRASPGSTYELPAGHLENLTDDVPSERVDGWIGDQGLLVVLATDGLFDPVLMTHDRGWFGDDPDDLSLGFAVPPERRGSADTVADTLMDTSRFAGWSTTPPSRSPASRPSARKERPAQQLGRVEMPKSGAFEFTTDKRWDDTPEVAPDAVRDVLVVGDIHGSKTHLLDAVTQAADFGAQAIVQVGDFWLADRHWSQFSAQQADYMHTACESPLPVVVVDGNHEVWPALGRYALTWVRSTR